MKLQIVETGHAPSLRITEERNDYFIWLVLFFTHLFRQRKSRYDAHYYQKKYTFALSKHRILNYRL